MTGKCASTSPIRNYFCGYDFVYCPRDNKKVSRRLNILDASSKNFSAIRVDQKLNSSHSTNGLLNPFILHGPAACFVQISVKSLLLDLQELGLNSLRQKPLILNHEALGRMVIAYASMALAERQFWIEKPSAS